MIQFGLSLMACSLPPLLGVLHAIRANVLAEFHGRQLQDPLAVPLGRWQRWHLQYSSCLDCQMALERAVTRLQ